MPGDPEQASTRHPPTFVNALRRRRWARRSPTAPSDQVERIAAHAGRRPRPTPPSYDRRPRRHASSSGSPCSTTGSATSTSRCTASPSRAGTTLRRRRAPAALPGRAGRPTGGVDQLPLLPRHQLRDRRQRAFRPRRRPPARRGRKSRRTDRRLRQTVGTVLGVRLHHRTVAPGVHPDDARRRPRIEVDVQTADPRTGRGHQRQRRPRRHLPFGRTQAPAEAKAAAKAELRGAYRQIGETSSPTP